jgi:hypothetical protein
MDAIQTVPEEGPVVLFGQLSRGSRNPQSHFGRFDQAIDSGNHVLFTVSQQQVDVVLGLDPFSSHQR